ncbi:CAAX protease self-immunity [Verrucomicrobium sp. GAS474]|uniref:CPBP family intramembrane glutamic endopeptidase n=1 Tax=Verrucomicrobium sp. GAS474 TaxID=1882831 RepID=UPI00087C483C|nr:CPBP family intramembrane glutamic endopeptidase [Verrucomicrobium sp. GAS474]SDU30133.1 CAAX protease self-immunity [Verrucomicrobium sp. GAS474]
MRFRSSPSPALSLFGLIVFPFVAAAVLAPWVWHALHGLLHYPFPRYVNRCLMLSALLGLWLFWKGLGIGSLSETGWHRTARLGRDLGGGFFLGLATGAAALLCALLLGGQAWQADLPFLKLLGIVAGAWALAPLEELLFRGVIQRVLEKRFGIAAAIVVGSLIFALLHYLKVPSDFKPATPGIGDGFRAVGLAFTPFAGLGWCQPRLGLLVAVGLVLALARWRTGALWLPIGLHAGWIVAERAGHKLTQGLPGHWAGGDFSTNPLSFLFVAVAALVVWKWPASSSK